MNLDMNELRPHLTMWFNWWLGGWNDAWALIPKATASQTRPPVLQTLEGTRLTFQTATDGTATWQASDNKDIPQGALLDDDDVLLRTLNLPSLSARDIATTVAMDVHIASPFPPSDTHYGFSTHRNSNGTLCIEIAITRQSRLVQLQSRVPQTAFYARGQNGAIPLQSDTHANASAWYRSPLTLSLSVLLCLVLIAWIISPTLLLRAEAQAHEIALAKLNREATPLLEKREELSTLQQQLENAHAFDSEHPNPQIILEQLSGQIPDSTWISQLNLRKDQLTLEGSSDNAIAIVGLLEKIPTLKEVRLGASINRDPRNGRETFQILARIHPETVTPTPGQTTATENAPSSASTGAKP